MQVVIATGNAGKLREMSEILAPLDIEVVAQSHYAFEPAEETGLSFVENALLKARHACLHTGLPAIADDSGLEVDALNGAPGIYSARYASEGASDEANMNKLIAEVRDLPEEQRSARFICVMVYLAHAEDPVPVVAEGIWNGIAITTPRGENGFGYDPMFYLPERDCTSAQLPAAIKNSLSHRGQALRQLVEKLS